MTEKRIIAVTGSLGAACMAASTVVGAVDLAGSITQTFQVLGVALGAVGTFLTAGIAYYKGAMAS